MGAFSFSLRPHSPLTFRLRRGMPPRQISVPRPNPRGPLGYSRISPTGGAMLLVGIICTPAGGAFKVKVCSHLRWRRPFTKPSKHAYPAGADFCSCKSQQNTLGALPQDPCRWLCWIRINLRRSRKSIRTAHRIAPKVACGSICPFPPPPFPRRERGPDGLMKSGRQFGAWGMLGLAESQAADPWLWLAGLSVCTEREGVPLPRSGGGWEGANAPAAPYKHRLAHDPGRQSRSGRAFRCVGVLGQRPKRVLVPFTRVKGTPRRRAVPAVTHLVTYPRR